MFENFIPHKNKEIKRMLSKKMAFSLMSLITIIALAFVAPSAMAGNFKVKFSAGDSSLVIPATSVATTATANLVVESDRDLPADIGSSVTLYVRDENGAAISMADSTASPAVQGYTVTVTDDTAYTMRTARKRQLTVVVTLATNETPARNVRTVVLTIPTLTTPDPTVAAADSKSDAVNHTLHIRAAAAADATSRPKVVSIQRLRPGSQTVVSAFEEQKIKAEPFDVRIVLTEAGVDWKADKIGDRIKIDGGTVSDLVVGVPFERQGPHADTTADPTTSEQAQTVVPHPIEGRYAHDGIGNNPFDPLVGTPVGLAPAINVPLPSGPDDMYHQYRVTVTPHKRDADFTLKISVKEFHDGASPYPNYYRPIDVDVKPNGREQLRLTVEKTPKNLTAGYRVTIPKEKYIPGGGYLVIVKSKGGSEVDTTGQDNDRTKDAPRATHRKPAQLLYNVYEAASLPNLATQFRNGVVVDVESGNALYITEVMWGEDVSLNPSSNSQYIELYNPGAGFNTPDDDKGTLDVDERLTLVFYAPNEFGDVPAATTDATTGATIYPGRIKDRIGTLDAKGTYWSPEGKGASGRSGTGEAESLAGRTTPIAVPIVSMYRGMDTTGGVEPGQMATSWLSSAGPKSANFDPTALGIRHGTPGAATDATVTPADTAAEEQKKEDKAKADAEKIANTGTYPKAGDGRVYISEIMFAGDGVLPQWIEIANADLTKEFNLSDWTITVDNAVADADVDVGATATFTIPKGTKIAPSKPHDPAGDNTPSTILVVTEAGRNSFTRTKEAGQVINLAVDREVDLLNAGVVTRRYTLLSDIAFEITLAPGVPTATKAPAGETAAAKTKRLADARKETLLRQAATDVVGNLGADGAAMWALPTNEGGPRSSIIRRHVDIVRGPKSPEDGVKMENWALAADTAFADPMHGSVNASYYGAANDIGTPGFRAGGALPVELSHFRPARDKATGQVVITWATQSELNNAGFFIKRSQQRNGEFKVINATMIAGAGTTSEKQFYTYTDTTAQPNVVYYYQIEDVSLDGNRQTLTRGIRLKGHIGAAGKATTLWGELKSSNE